MYRASSLTTLALALLSGCSDQGFTAFDKVDVFRQNPPDEVDILMVVDDSCSMGPYQARLGANFDQFISWFIEADVDYQIGVVTTDIIDPSKAGQIQGQVITNETENAEAVFSSIVNVGVSGAGFETGLEAASLALQDSSGANAGFLRDEASLSIIFVSDEEDASPGGVNGYINEFIDVKGARNRDVFNASALIFDDAPECTEEQRLQSTVGTRYRDVALQTAGVVGSLCETDFENIVFDLSLASSRLQTFYYLSDEPNLDTLEVSVAYPDDDGNPGSPEIIRCDAGVWTYQELDDPVTGEEARPAIVFEPDQIPPVGARITARFFGGDADPAAFCEDEADTNTEESE